MSTITISTAPAEEAATVRALLRANLLSVFNERDDSARVAAVSDIYAEDVVWYEPGDVVRGHEALNKRAGALLVTGLGPVQTSWPLASYKVRIPNY